MNQMIMPSENVPCHLVGSVPLYDFESASSNNSNNNVRSDVRNQRGRRMRDAEEIPEAVLPLPRL